MCDSNSIEVLDTTLRDGGLGLEDAYKNGIQDRRFTQELRECIIKDLHQSKIEIIELGALERSGKDNRGFEIYETLEELSSNIPEDSSDRLYTALFRGPDIPLKDIPQWREGLCPGVRLIVRYSEMKKSLDYCASLSQKGYKVFVQPMLTMRYSEEELDMVINYVNSMNAYAVYFVDSYGYMDSEDVTRLAKYFDNQLESGVRLGFHSHNNMNLAFANAKAFIDYPTTRKKIIDSCILGMGQGAGNLQSEIIIPYLNRALGKKYDYDAILDACEYVETFLNNNLWGYSVTTLIPALYRTAYKYSIILRHKYGFGYVDINHIIRDMPDELRQRYTFENLKVLLKDFKE